MTKIETIKMRERHDGLGRAVAMLDGFQLHGSRLETWNPE
jgi:hypothetical protein